MLALVSHADVERMQRAVLSFVARAIHIVQRLHLINPVISDALLLCLVLGVGLWLILWVCTFDLLLSLLLFVFEPLLEIGIRVVCLIEQICLKLGLCLQRLIQATGLVWRSTCPRKLALHAYQQIADMFARDLHSNDL